MRENDFIDPEVKDQEEDFTEPGSNDPVASPAFVDVDDLSHRLDVVSRHALAAIRLTKRRWAIARLHPCVGRFQPLGMVLRDHLEGHIVRSGLSYEQALAFLARIADSDADLDTAIAEVMDD